MQGAEFAAFALPPPRRAAPAPAPASEVERHVPLALAALRPVGTRVGVRGFAAVFATDADAAAARAALAITANRPRNMPPWAKTPSLACGGGEGRTVTMPRALGLAAFGAPPFPKQRGAECMALAVSSLRLYDRQAAAMEAAVRLLESDDPAERAVLVHAETGAGKTELAAGVIRRMCRRTAIVAPSIVLGAQARERFERLFPTARFADCKEGKPSVDGDVIFATAQTFARLSSEDLSTIGLIVLDEAHSVPADTFRAVMNTAAPILGLSATPSRIDGFTPVIWWVFGRRLKMDPAPPVGAAVTVFRLVNGGMRPKRFPGGGGGVNKADLLNQVAAHDDRTALVVAQAKARIDEGRALLVFADRVAHVRAIAKALNGYKGEEVGIIADGVRGVARHIVATYASAKQGVDGAFDTLIVGTAPPSNVQQVMGRLRHGRTDKQPRVDEFRDVGEGFSDLRSVDDHYRKKGWPVSSKTIDLRM